MSEKFVKLDLLDEDSKRLFKLAYAHGLTVSELIENFIADLTCGDRRNGSDECDYANDWFNRCWFSTFPEVTYIKYLIDTWELENVFDYQDSLQDMKSDMEYTEDEEERQAIQEEINYQEESLKEIYDDYVKSFRRGDEKPQSYDEAMAAVKKCREDYEKWME